MQNQKLEMGGFKSVTLFTRDENFFNRDLGHAAYGLFWLDVAPEETALFARRFLRYPLFRTKASRMGMVARAHHDGIRFWQRKRAGTQSVKWEAIGRV